MFCPKCNHDVNSHEFIHKDPNTAAPGFLPFWVVCKGCALTAKSVPAQVAPCNLFLVKTSGRDQE